MPRRKKGSLKIGRPKLKIPFEFWEIFILWKSGEVKTKELLELCSKEYGMSTRTFFRRMRELDSRYGDIPPEKLRDYIVEDDFADGIEFAMERIEDVVGIWNPYAGNRAKAQERKITSGYIDDYEAEMGNLTKKEHIIRAEAEGRVPEAFRPG